MTTMTRRLALALAAAGLCPGRPVRALDDDAAVPPIEFGTVSPLRQTVATRRDRLAAGSDMLGQLTYLVTKRETILLDEAWARDLGILAVNAANPGVDAWVPGAERLIMMPTAHLLPEAPRTPGVLINTAELRLFHFAADGSIGTHAIGVGRDGHDTPLGQTTIVRKAIDPVWRPTPETRRDRPDLPAAVGPGPDNPMGDRALYLGWPTYAMHGTNKPYGVGRRASRGCIRLYPEVVRHLHEILPLGTKVSVVRQPVKVGWHDGELWVEAHPANDQLEQLEASYSFTPVADAAASVAARQLVEQRAGPEVGRVRWHLVEAELVSRRGVPVQVTGRYPVQADGTSAPGSAPSLGDAGRIGGAPLGGTGLSPRRNDWPGLY